MKKNLIALASGILASFFVLTVHAELPIPTYSFAFEDSPYATEGTWSSWEYDNGTCTYVDSTRVNPFGGYYKAATISADFHPGSSHTWQGTYSAVVYANVSAAPDKGVIMCFADNIWLRKVNATTMSFGNGAEATMATTTLEGLNEGYHVFIIKKTPTTLSIQIDNSDPVVKTTELMPSNSALQLGVDWTGLSGDADLGSGILIDELLIYDGKELSVDECAALYAKYTDVITTTNDEYDLSEAGATTTTISAISGFKNVSSSIATVKLASGATLKIDQTLQVLSLILVCEGSCTLAVADASYLGSAQLDVSGVTGTATLEYTVGAESSVTTIPFSGFDVVKKLGSGTYSTTTDTFAGAQLIVSEGSATLDANLSSTIATAENPMTVTGTGTELKLKGTNHQKNRLPNGGTVLATDGATLAIEGVNLFADGANRPFIKADNATFRVDTYSGSHMKVNTVTLSNNAILQLAGTATAYSSEALVLDNDGSQITVTSGTENKLEYASGATENTLKVTSGIIEVAADAKLISNIVLAENIAKKGNGELEMPQTRLKNAEIQEGTLSVTGATGSLTQTISGEGTLKLAITDELKVPASQLEGFTGSIEVTSGIVVLPLAQAKTVTMATGTTLKVALTAEEQFNDQNITKEGVTVYFYNEDGSIPLVTDSEGNALPGAYTAPTKTWMISSADPVNWSAATWMGGTPGDTDAACIDVGEYDVTVTMDAADTLKSLQIKGTTGRLTLTGSNALTVTDLLDVKVNVDVISTVLVLPETVIESGATLAYEVPADATAALPNMSGEGIFAKKGAGAVRFDTNQHENDVVADGITIELYEGAYYVGLNDDQVGGDPYLRDATVKFVNAGVAFGSFGWLHLEGTVTVDVPATVTDAALGSLPDKMLPSVQGENATLVKTGDGDFKAAFDNIQTIQINGGAIVVDGTKTMQGVIAGTGKVKTVAEAFVTLSGTNTYTGGTDIVEGATLKITNPNALGTTGTITGAGVLEVSGTYASETIDPLANTSGLTAETWTGTVRYTTAGHQAHFYLDSVGNANSEIEFAGATGYFYKSGWSERGAATVRLTGEGLQMQNGSSGSSSNMKLFVPKLVGDGKLKGPGGSHNWNYTIVIDDASEFAGDIYLSTGHATQFGVIIGTDTLPSGYSAANYWKHITIVAGGVAKIAEGKTWTPAANSQVKVYGTIGGKGTVATALAFQDGATLDATEGALTVTGAVTFGTSLLVKVAEDAAFPFEFLKKTNGIEAPTGVQLNVQVGENDPIPSVYDFLSTDTGLAVAYVGVARIGDQPYPTLQAAIDAAFVLEGDVIIDLFADTDEAISLEEGEVVTIRGMGGRMTGTIVIPEHATLHLIADENRCPPSHPWTISGAIQQEGALTLSGNISLSSAANQFSALTVPAGSELSVVAGVEDQPITVESEAILKVILSTEILTGTESYTSPREDVIFVNPQGEVVQAFEGVNGNTFTPPAIPIYTIKYNGTDNANKNFAQSIFRTIDGTEGAGDVYWHKFCSGTTHYSAAGTVLRIAADSVPADDTVAAHKLFRINFGPPSFAGLRVESGATGFSIITDSTARPLRLGLADVTTTYTVEEDFLFHYTNLRTTGVNSESFIGRVVLDIAEGKTLTIKSNSVYTNNMTKAQALVFADQGQLKLENGTLPLTNATSLVEFDVSAFTFGRTTDDGAAITPILGKIELGPTTLLRLPAAVTFHEVDGTQVPYWQLATAAEAITFATDNLYVDGKLIPGAVVTLSATGELTYTLDESNLAIWTGEADDGLWATVGNWKNGVVPNADKKVTIDAQEAITITLPDEAVAVADLMLTGTGGVTFAAAGSATQLTSTRTQVFLPVDVSAITANLGSITIAAESTLTIGAQTTFTIENGTYDGTLKVVGGTQNTPVVVNLGTSANAYIGKVFVPAGSWVRLHAESVTADTSANKVYHVTGEGHTSHVYLTASKNWGVTESVNSRFDNLTLEIPSTYITESVENKTFYLRPNVTTDSVRFITSQPIVNDPGTGPYRFASLAGAGGFNMGGHGIKIFDGADANYSGVLSGTGFFTKAGEGTQILSGANTYTGGTVIEAGTLKLTGNGALGSGTVTISAGATLALDNAPLPPAQLPTVAGQGAIEVQSGEAHVGSDFSAYTGTVAIANGATLMIHFSGGTDQPILRPAPGTTFSEANVRVFDMLGSELTIEIVNNGDGSYTIHERSTPVWTTAEGNFNTASLWSTGKVPTGKEPLIVFSVATDTVVNLMGGAYSFSAIRVEGPGSLTFINGTIEVTTTLSVASGATLIQNGCIKAPNFVLPANATLVFDARGLTDGLTNTKAISGDGAVKTYGNVTMSVANTFTGGLTVEEGILATTTRQGFGGSGDSEYNANIIVRAGGAVDINHTIDYCYGYTIEGSGVQRADGSYTGALFHSGEAMGTGSRQTWKIALSGDAVIDVATEWGLVANDNTRTYLWLNGYTLIKKGAGSFHISNTRNTDHTRGTLRILEGSLYFQHTDSVLTDVHLTIENNANLNLATDISGFASVTFKGGKNGVSLSGDLTKYLASVVRPTVDASWVDLSTVQPGETITLFSSDLTKGTVTNGFFSAYNVGSRFTEATFSEATSKVTTTVKADYANFYHYDFQQGADTRVNAQAEDSTFAVNGWGESSNPSYQPTRNGRAVKLFATPNGDGVADNPRFTPWWETNTAGKSPFYAGVATITTILKPVDTTMRRVVWGLGTGGNDSDGYGAAVGVALVVEDEKTISLVSWSKRNEMNELVRITEIPNLRKGYQFVAATFAPEGTTLQVGNRKNFSSIAFPLGISAGGQLGSAFRGLPGQDAGYGIPLPEGIYLDDWQVYDARLTEAEIRAIKRRYAPTPFSIHLR